MANKKQFNAQFKKVHDRIILMYLDYWNNFLTIDSFAEHYNIDRNKALNIITRGKKLFDSK
ncbi:MAG: hypothetical protein Unbinned5089contig1000_22 [Prokaryotic dsDNA virus sp.]|nr:MAG: hypothetical protein Unbinned5089contig1000_22 [Prokaryotic dsDNA virus sp.]|tara:strand:- start:52 stop:234 length:183 start_codon:yes stop_codon:yes gene_type:complete